MKKVFLSHRFDFLEPDDVIATVATFRSLMSDIDVKLISASRRLLEERKQGLDRHTIRQIVEDDLNDVKDADIVLLDVSLEGWNYIGVTCEMVYAYLWGKPIIAYVGDTSNCERLWLRYHASAICRTHAEVKDCIRGYAS
jgi:nucleoside 2-deoxyribosyltransferase